MAMKTLVTSCALLPLLISGAVGTQSTSNVRYVNPMIGTQRKSENDGNYGGMIPSTAVPFAMTRWTPTTRQNVVGSCPYGWCNVY